MKITIPNKWTARRYQKPTFNNFGWGKKYQRAACVWHRRAGKDSMGLNLTAREMFKRVGTYWHLFPEQTQARRAIWNGVDKKGRRILEQVFPGFLKCMKTRKPSGVVKRVSGQELLIELVNGSIWQMAGSDNYDSLVGSNPVGVVFSEYSIANPLAWDYIRPILLENGGFAIFIYTPRGRTHGYKLFQMALSNDDWIAERLTYKDTGVLTEADIESEREAGMSENKIAQEYGCDFEAENDDQLIATASVVEAQTRSFVSGLSDPMILGVDVARFGDDKTVIYPRRGSDARSMPVEVYAKLDTMAVVGKVTEAIAKYKPDAVFIDLGNMGAGVVDRLNQLGYNVIGVNFGGSADMHIDGGRLCKNKRTQMWSTMGDAIKASLAIISDPRLEFELLSPNYTYDSNNAIVLESKDAMKLRGVNSPDIADALALTYAYPAVAGSIQREEEQDHDDNYDPFGWGDN
tara:strand:- start:13905 stop:15287 length:1383 start_codon:yes stop_codon:yes gene_type:complete